MAKNKSAGAPTITIGIDEKDSAAIAAGCYAQFGKLRLPARRRIM
jgi:hypothetical protein